MEIKDLIRLGKIRKSSIDLQLVKSLIARAEKELKFIRKLGINDESKDSIFFMYYEILRKIIEAIFILDGYKVYSHEAFTFLLKEKGEIMISEKFDRYRKLRNGINYYGKEVNISDVNISTSDIIKIINYLKNKYLKNK